MPRSCPASSGGRSGRWERRGRSICLSMILSSIRGATVTVRPAGCVFRRTELDQALKGTVTSGGSTGKKWPNRRLRSPRTTAFICAIAATSFYRTVRIFPLLRVQQRLQHKILRAPLSALFFPCCAGTCGTESSTTGSQCRDCRKRSFCGWCPSRALLEDRGPSGSGKILL